MIGIRSIVLGVLVGVIVYFGVQRVFPSSQRADISRLMSPSVSPITSLSPKVTRGDKSGVTKSVTVMSPSVSPLSPSVTPHISPTPVPTRTPVPYTSISPAPTPIATIVPVTPSSSVAPTPSPTPSLIPTPTTTPIPTTAPSEARVVINEIAWMGTESSYTDEWIELYNPGTDAVDLSGWRLKSADGKPDIALSGQVGAGEYYLIERTSDTTISDVAADLIITFGTGLGDAGERLTLYRADLSVADEVNCVGGWFSGDKSSRSSMERIDPLGSGDDGSNWGSNDSTLTIGHDAAGGVIRGTPRGRNSLNH